jgi:hypothetical protein
MYGWDVARLVQCLPRKWQVPNSNPSTPKKKKAFASSSSSIPLSHLYIVYIHICNFSYKILKKDLQSLSQLPCCHSSAYSNQASAPTPLLERFSLSHQVPPCGPG